MIDQLKNSYTTKIELEKKQCEIKNQLKRKLFFHFISKLKLQTELKEIDQKVIEIKKKLETSTREYLFLTDKKYAELVETNKNLLSKNEFTVKTFQKGYMDGYTEKEFKGKITENGFLYLFSVEIFSNSYYTYQNNYMSSLFKGSFNELGYYNAKSVESEFHLMIPRIPETFKAKGGEDGSFTMITDQKYWDLSGNEYVEKMVGDPFNSVNYDRNKFLNNRLLMNENVSNFLTKISEI